jgi:hypothetical protein
MLKIAIENDRKLLYPYFQYIKYLVRKGYEKLTKIELEYIRKRLNYYNHESRCAPGKGFKPGFWSLQAKYLNALPTIEELDGAFIGERDKVIERPQDDL